LASRLCRVKVRHLEQVSGIRSDIFLGRNRLFADLFDTHRIDSLALPDRPNDAKFDWENARINSYLIESFAMIPRGAPTVVSRHSTRLSI
jgi:hypothetical protein